MTQQQSEKSRYTTPEKPQTHSLPTLHEQLRAIDLKNSVDTVTVEQIQASIRSLLPQVDTGKALPQKKTPSGGAQVLHVNYKPDKPDKPVQVELEHLKFFARTAQALGLQLKILAHENHQAEIQKELEKTAYQSLKYDITLSQTPVSKWAEDSIEYLANGTFAVLYPFNDQLLAWAMTEGRRQRWQGKISQNILEEALQDDHLWIPLGMTVNTDATGLERERIAKASGQPIGHIRAYIEGGNMITGENASGLPIIILGKDAIDTTAYLYQIDNHRVKQIIIEDFGLETLDQLICVEQPGQFHLDMGMLFLGNGVVVVNDSQAALKDAKEMAELVPCLTTETLAAKLGLQYELEESAVLDLKQAGLDVIRETLKDDTLHYNFFNGEFVVGQDGFNYYITNGGPKEQQIAFETLMVNEWMLVKQVFFSPQAVAQISLQERGGVGCRIKAHA